MSFANPMPARDDLADYNASYFDVAHGGAPTSAASAAYHAAMARLRVDHVRRLTDGNLPEDPAVLEIGPGGGQFAKRWLELMPRSRYFVIESDASCHPVLTALGASVLANPGALPQGSELDVVAMSHVLEHVAEPAGFIAGMTTGLRRGGVLFIEVPCRDYEYKQQDEPHLLFFDAEPMRRLLNRCGFRDSRVTYHGEPITRLARPPLSRRIAGMVADQLLARGVLPPFSAHSEYLTLIDDPLGRAAVRRLSAHKQRDVPARWLRTVAFKA